MRKNSIKILVFSLLALLFCFTIGAGCKKDDYKLNIVPSSLVMTEGEQVTLQVETDLTGKLEWTSSDYKVVNILPENKIMAVGEGNAIVTVKISNKTATMEVTVNKKPNEDVVIELNTNFNSISLYKDQEVKSEAYITENGIKAESKITYISSDPEICSVAENGMIKAVKTGTAKITVSADYKDKGYTKVITVIVRDNIIIAFTQPEVQIISLTDGVPTTKQIECTVIENGVLNENAKITYKTNNKDILNVSDSGLVTVKKVGKASIKAEYIKDDITYDAVAVFDVLHNKENIVLTEKYYATAGAENTEIKFPSSVNVSGLNQIIADNGKTINVLNATSDTVTVLSLELPSGRHELMFYDNYSEYTAELYCADYVWRTPEDYESFMSYGQPEQNNPKKGKVVLANDIDFGNREYYYVSNFSDVTLDFDGDGHIISNGITNGFFANVTGGVYTNLIIKDTTIKTAPGFDRGGAFSNSITSGAIVDNIVILNPKAETLSSNAGMITGRIYSDKTTLQNILVVDTSLVKMDKLYSVCDVIGESASTSVYKNVYCISVSDYEKVSSGINYVNPKNADWNIVKTFDDFLVKESGSTIFFKNIEKIENDYFVADEKINIPYNFITIEGEIEKQAENIITINDLAEKSVSAVYINGVDIPFTQNNAEISFSKDVFNNVSSGKKLNAIITVDTDRYIGQVDIFDYIRTVKDYKNMMNYDTPARDFPKKGYYKLHNDIDMGTNSFRYTVNKSDFTGTFDGCGHVIKGGITNGYFANVMGGVIKNVIFYGVTVKDWERGGVVANTIGAGAVLDNVYVINARTEVETEEVVGMLFGRIYTSTTVVKNCLVVDKVSEKFEKTSLIGGTFGSSATGCTLENVFALSDKDYISLGKTVEVLPDIKCSDYEKFVSLAGVNFKNFELIITDKKGDVSIGNIPIFSLENSRDNIGEWNENWFN